MAPSTRPLLALGLALGLLTACTGGGSDNAATASTDSAAGGAAEAPAAAPAAGAAAPAVAPAQAALVDRSLVRTAEVRVEVTDVRQAADRVGSLARGAGGAVRAEDRSGDGDSAQADLTVSVPPARLDTTLDAVARLGKERERQSSTEDVTEQVVDLDSRLATARASVARVRALLDRATGLGDVVKIEGELARREADLESLQARVRTLSAKVDLATLVVHLDGGTPPRVVATGTTGFRDGLHAGWAAFLGGARVLAATAGALLPFLPLLLVGGLVLRWVRLRRTAA